ncbi:hypothetical protein Tco_0490834 [Tanacetum coccineum]
MRQPRNDKKTFQRSRDDKNDKNQRAFVEGSWSDSGEEDDEKVKNKTCLVAQASSEICSESSYFSDENSSTNDLVLDYEYDKLNNFHVKFMPWELYLPLPNPTQSASNARMLSSNKLWTREILRYKAYNRGNVIFGSNLRGNIIGKGQICDNKCRVTFSEHDSKITKDGKVIGRVRMTKVIKGEFEKIKDVKVEDVSLTCDTPLEVFNKEVSRLSRMDNDLFTYEVEVTNIPCNSKIDDDSEHEADDDMGYMMIKYSFNNDEEYVAVKEDEYDDLTITRKEACQAYQEIFQIMDEGWMVTRAE